MILELTEQEMICLRNFVSVSYGEGYPGHEKDYGNLTNTEFNALLRKLGFTERGMEMYGARVDAQT